MKKRVICFGLFALVGSVSCSDITSINKNPLASAEPEDVSQLLSYAMLKYTHTKASQMGWHIGHVVHHFSYAVSSPAGGNVNQVYVDNFWDGLYESGVLNNLSTVDAVAREKGAKLTKIRVLTKTLMAMAFFDITCIFNDAPFSEALSVEQHPYPKFDTQEQILDGVVNLLDEAIALADQVVNSQDNIDLSGADLLLGGDIQRWKELANSLKIRTLMLIRNVGKRKTDAEKKLAEAFGKPIISAPVQFLYPGGANGSNAYYGFLVSCCGGSNLIGVRYAPPSTIRNMLAHYRDPRLRLWVKGVGNVESTAYPTLPVAPYSENQQPLATHLVYSTIIFRGDLPDIYMLPSELDFYRAELILGGTLAGDPQEAFEKGVKNAITYWGRDIPGLSKYITNSKIETLETITKLEDQEIDECIKTLGKVNLKKIHEQLWLESFLQPVVAWNSVRRTGIPSLKPPPRVNIKTILKRFPVSNSGEVQSNPNVPSSSATAKLDEPMWFENAK